MPRVRVEVIQEYIDKRQWSLSKFARRADMATITLIKILNGTTTNPGVQTLAAIADVMDMRVVDLIAEDEPVAL